MEHLLHPDSELFLIENANHIFAAKELWKEKILSKDLHTVTENIDLKK